jgi:hypothetical protein
VRRDDARGDLAAERAPIVRMIVFIPVATPVRLGCTASTTRFAIDAKAKPIPSPSAAEAK